MVRTISSSSQAPMRSLRESGSAKPLANIHASIPLAVACEINWLRIANDDSLLMWREDLGRSVMIMLSGKKNILQSVRYISQCQISTEVMASTKYITRPLLRHQGVYEIILGGKVPTLSPGRPPRSEGLLGR